MNRFEIAYSFLPSFTRNLGAILLSLINDCSVHTLSLYKLGFELVLWIYLWFHATKIGRVNINFQRSNDSTKPPIQVSTGSGILQSTAYPYYLSIDPRTKGYVKIKEGLDTTSFDASPGVDTPIAKYQTSMNHLAGMLRITDLFTQVSTARTGGTHVETALSHLVAATWPLISYQVTKERPASKYRQPVPSKAFLLNLVLPQSRG